jgi:hypothetical protein
MYRIEFTKLIRLNVNRYRILDDDHLYQCPIKNSSIIDNILFLKGIKLEEHEIKYLINAYNKNLDTILFLKGINFDNELHKDNTITKEIADLIIPFIERNL